jgi:excisionase family DNA binding protein
MDPMKQRTQDNSSEAPVGAVTPLPTQSWVSGAVSTREAADALGLSERTVRRAVLDGHLTATRVGSAYRIDPESLHRFAAQLPAAGPRPLADVVAFPGRESATAPAQLSSFVGRDAELAAVLASLHDPATRLLTLTGPGGIGKTRLAIAAADAIAADSFRDGAVFVALADVPSPELVLPAIVLALGLHERPGQKRKDQLLSFLRGKQLLLLLDNFEHVLDAGPEIAALLIRSPGVKALVTSRAPLRVMGERELPAPPLTLAGAAASPAELLASEAGRLFAERAQEHNPSFQVDAASAPLIADICARLDGLPLAIELAAARVNVLTLDRLHARLGQRLQVLTRGPRDAPARHGTMRDAIAWSYDLLSPVEQRFFRRLAIFPGGATLYAAAAVCGGDARPDAEAASDVVIDTIASLTEQSLIRVDTGLDGERRFRMLETIREFGLEQLAAAGEDDEARAALAGYVTALAASLRAPEMLAPDRLGLDRLEASRAELHAALVWLEGRDPAVFVRLAGMMTGYWYGRNHYQEAQDWLERALVLADEATALDVARVQVGMSRFQVVRGEYDVAAAGFDRGIPVLRVEGSRAEATVAIMWRAALALYRGEHELAEAAFVDACQMAELVDDPRQRAKLLGLVMANHGVAARARGEFGLAESRFQVALEQFQAHDTAVDAGKPFLALTSLVLDEMGHLALDRGDYTLALSHYQAFLDKMGAHDEQQLIAAVLVGVARVATAWGRFTSAARLFAMADALQQQLGLGMVLPGERADRERDLAIVRAQLGEVAFAAAWSERQPFSLDAARDELAALAPPAPALAVTRDGLRALDALTRREHDVLRQMAEQKTDQEIADALFLSRRTVNWHVRSILSKLDAPSRREAVVNARNAGLL